MEQTTERQADLDEMVEAAAKLPGVAEIIAVHGAAARSMSGVTSIPTFMSRSATGGNA